MGEIKMNQIMNEERKKVTSRGKKNHLLGFVQGFILFNVLWWIFALGIQSKALPSPFEVYPLLPKMLKEGMLHHVGVSLKRLGLGLFWATLIGASLGYVMGKMKWANKILSPLVYFTYPIPKTALLPILMILGGLGDTSKMILIVLITVFPMMIAVRDSMLQVDPGLEHVLISLGANPLQKMWHVTLPAIFPQIMTQLRLSIGTSLSVLFFAENYGTQLGLGYYVQDYWARMNYPYMYGGILMLALLGCSLFILLDLVESTLIGGK